MPTNYTLVDFYGNQTKSDCGYCKQSSSSQSQGMWTYNMTPSDYQELVDRGWRRCGMYTYKPSLKTTCCPSYTIKCDVNEFRLTKSQKKIIKKMNRFLLNGIKDNTKSDVDHHEDGGEGGGGGGGSSNIDPHHVQRKREAPIGINFNEKINKNVDDDDSTTAEQTSTIKNCTNQLAEQLNDEPSSSNLINVSQKPIVTQCKKAKILRMERKLKKLSEKQSNVNSIVDLQLKSPNKNIEKTLEMWLNEKPTNGLHQLKVILLPSNESNESSPQTFELYKKYQIHVHKDPVSKLTKESFERFLVRNPLQVLLRPCKENTYNELNQQEYELYKRYQNIIHSDPPADSNEFIDFLIKSPLEYSPSTDGDESSPPMGYGTFHQQYWLDDRLIAVGVLDVLPKCVSSVYFFYDPDYDFLSLGSYGAFCEIQFTCELLKIVPELNGYYMGFYIHSCPKMRYKAKIKPSYLLCPETYRWHLLDESVLNRLDKTPYQRLSNDPQEIEQHEFNENSDLDKLMLVYKKRPIKYELFKQLTKPTTSQLTNMIEYGKAVGNSLSAHMFLLVQQH